MDGARRRRRLPRVNHNGNGRIDDGTDVFGTATPVLNGASTAANAFEALRFYQVDGRSGPAFTDMDRCYCSKTRAMNSGR
jgi:hypothetical protein